MSPAPRKSSAGKSPAGKSSAGKSSRAAKSSAGKSSVRDDAGKPRAPRCKTCGRRIHVPKGWSSGPAVRKHYWAKHPEIMRGPGRSR